MTNYSGNILADIYYNDYQNYIEMEKEKAYYCSSCEEYTDSTGKTLNRFTAVDNYDVEQSICDDCTNDEDFNLFETLGNALRP